VSAKGCKDIPVTLTIGALLGTIMGLSAFCHTAVSNGYVGYRMLGLVALVLRRDLNSYVAYFALAVAAYHAIGMVLVRAFGLDRAKLLRFGTMALVIAVVMIPADWVLSSLTRFTLPLIARTALARAASILAGRVPLSHYLSLIRGRGLEVVLLAVCLGLLVLLVRAVGRLDWSAAERLTGEWRDRLLRGGIVVIAMLAAVNLYGLTLGRAGAEGATNVVLIVVDCLRPDHLACYGYPRATSPHIDSLAEKGVVFRHAYSNAPWTKPSVSTIFTSLYPNVHTALDVTGILPQSALTVAEVFKNRGYRTHFLCGGNPSVASEFGFGEGFDRFLNPDPGLDAAALTDRLCELAPELRRGGVFAYVHYMDVHLPYNVNVYNGLFTQGRRSAVGSPGEIRVDQIRDSTRCGRLSEEDRDYLISLYDGQIRFVDENIGRIVDLLAEERLLESTVVVITADHGEELWDHGNFEHGHTVYDELLSVPLIFAGGGLKSREVEDCVRLLDLMPTLVSMTESVRGRLRMQGVDLSGRLLGRTDYGEDLPVFAAGTLYGRDKACLIRDRWKLISNSADRLSPKQLVGYESSAESEMYDLEQDPLERRNLVTLEPERAADMTADLERFRSLGTPFGTRKRSIDGGLKKKMKALGYL
jgi:choline-sulfatase